MREPSLLFKGYYMKCSGKTTRHQREIKKRAAEKTNLTQRRKKKHPSSTEPINPRNHLPLSAPPKTTPPPYPPSHRYRSQQYTHSSYPHSTCRAHTSSPQDSPGCPDIPSAPCTVSDHPSTATCPPRWSRTCSSCPTRIARRSGKFSPRR